MTFGSLFAGIGGIDLGLERAGWKCRWQVEIDPYALKVLEKHWPNVARYGDITKLRGDELEPVDLICGGFPCQDLSQAGKQAGIEGTRSGLWFEFARIIRIVRPRYVLIENVPGLLIHDAMRRVIGELARCGYVGCWRSLRASEFGASHLRKRVFIVAYSSEAVPCGLGGLFDGERKTRGYDANGCDQDVASRAWNGRREFIDDPRTPYFPRPAQQPAFAPGPSDPRWPAILRERPDLAPALESPLCGMADGISDLMDRAMKDRTKRLGRLGNAVVPQIAEWIGRRIMEFEGQQ